MPAPAFLSKLPKPALFALYGALGGLIGALVFGELVWYLLRPASAPEPLTVPPPFPQLAVTASPQVSVYPGGSNTFGVQIARDRFTGSVTVTFDKLAPGLSATPIVIPEGETNGTARIVATDDVQPGPSTLKVTARANPNREGHALAVTFDKPVEVRVIELPPAPPRLAVSVSPKIQVYQRGKNTFAVQVARGGFTGEVEIAFDDLPDGVKAPSIPIRADRNEITVELTADGTAKPGAQPVKVNAQAKFNGAPLRAQATTTVDVISPPRVPVDIVFALDISGSMQWAINGTSRGIQKFVDELAKNQFDVRVGLVGFKDTTLGQPLKIVKVDGEKMTTSFAKFRDEVGTLRAGGGGAEGESSLDGVAEAAEFPFRDQVTRVIILITDEAPKRPDGRMKSIEETAKYIKEKKIDQMHIVTLPELKKPFTPLWEGAKGQYFDLKALNEGTESFEKLLPDVSKAIADLVADRPAGKPELPGLPPPPKLPDARAAGTAVTPAREPEKPTIAPPEVKSLQSNEKSAAGTEWRQVARSSLWTGMIAALVCLAILFGQKSYVQGGLPPLNGVLLGLGGGLLVGLVGGAAGQGLFLLAKTDSAVLGALFRVMGWAILGGLAGAGLSLFIPNLGVLPGLLGGVAGGAAGAIGYIAVSALTGDTVGRLAGGLALGAAIGLMVAFVERAFRKAWLEVRFGEREMITINLGPEPVKVGGDAKACAVWARGAAPVALLFFVRDGEVMCADTADRSEAVAVSGFSRTVGAVRVVVRTGNGDEPVPLPTPEPAPKKKRAATDGWDPLPVSAKPKTAKPVPPKPLALDEDPFPIPVVKPNIAAPKAGGGCPSCGRKIPGATGTRYCMLCDATF